MRRVAATFVFLALIYPLIAVVTGDRFGVGGAPTVAGVTTTATLLFGVPAFVLFFRRGWLSWWQFAFGGAFIGFLCTIPFAVGGTAVVGALAPAFLALGALHGLIFWALAIWRNKGLTRRSGAADSARCWSRPMSQSSIDADAFRDFERAAHDEIAEGYRDFFAAVTEYAIEPLLDAASVGVSARVLDVATGPGVLAARAARRGASPVVGIDLAPKMVAIAAAQYPGLDFHQGDAENLPFPDQSFDAVISNFGIGHFPRPEQAVREFVRVLAPHGVVALSWWDVPARHRLNGIFFDAVNEAHASPPTDLPPGPPMFRFSDDQELSALLRSAGLTEVAVQGYAFVHRLGSADELWNGILHGTVRTSIGIRRQPKEVRDRIRAAFNRLVQPYALEGSIQIPVAFKIVAGRRLSA